MNGLDYIKLMNSSNDLHWALKIVNNHSWAFKNPTQKLVESLGLHNNYLKTFSSQLKNIDYSLGSQNESLKTSISQLKNLQINIGYLPSYSSIIKEALSSIEQIDFEVYENYRTDYIKDVNTSNKLVHSPYFISNYLKVNGSLHKDYTSIDSFVIYICVSGLIKIKQNDVIYTLRKGESLLIPATIKHIELISKESTEILEVYY